MGVYVSKGKFLAVFAVFILLFSPFASFPVSANIDPDEDNDADGYPNWFEWRHPGCSMCNAMNPDRLETGERCASTSNRNFEGRQGTGGRTHLVSPVMAAAAAVTGCLTDARTFDQEE